MSNRIAQPNFTERAYNSSQIRRRLTAKSSKMVTAMEWDEQKVLANIRAADTDDLLDRITAYRIGMEEDAIPMIERELRERGVSADQIARHKEECRRECLFLPDGTAMMCSFCHKPAVKEGWDWYKIWWLVPFFPRRVRYCKEHAL